MNQSIARSDGKKVAHCPLLQAYEADIASGRLQDDPAQRMALERLQALGQALLPYAGWRFPGNWLQRLKCTGPAHSLGTYGLYIFGDVGRGKSMLMDLFFDHVPVLQKRRVHFHAFMQEVHALLNQQKQRKNQHHVMEHVAKQVMRRGWLLCFDEFEVTDIADAMLLGHLFDALFARGIVVVATSNRAIADLYQDGLQRQRFLPFIQRFSQAMEQVHLRSHTDYRMAHMQALQTTYFIGNASKRATFITESFADLTHGAKAVATELTVAGRTLTLEHTHGDIACTSFASLCAANLGAADYLAIAEQFTTLLLGDIPQMGAEHRNEARRFVLLIDALYEHRVKCLFSAEVAPDQLYQGGDGSFAFARTVSRLQEMQTTRYWKMAHKAT